MLFLSIIKIIGIVLLVIIGILLFLLILMLLFPVLYKGTVDYSESLNTDFSVKILGGIFRISASYKDEEWLKVYILGHLVNTDRILKDKKKTNYKNEKTPDSNQNSLSVKSEDIQIERLREAESEFRKETKKNTFKLFLERIMGYFIKFKKSICKSVSDFKAAVKDIKKKFIRLKIKITEIFKKLKNIQNFLEDDLTKSALNNIKRHTIPLLKHIAPKKSDLKLEFGFANPSTTGYVMAVVSPFYALYFKWLELIPDFERDLFTVKGSIRGHIVPAVALYHIFFIVFNKNLRKALKKYF